MIPLSTTTVTVRRPTAAAGADFYDAHTMTVVATDVRAHVDEPNGTLDQVDQSGGRTESLIASFNADPADIVGGDELTTADGTVWHVVWATHTGGMGLGHVSGQARLLRGGEPAG